MNCRSLSLGLFALVLTSACAQKRSSTAEYEKRHNRQREELPINVVIKDGDSSKPIVYDSEDSTDLDNATEIVSGDAPLAQPIAPLPPFPPPPIGGVIVDDACYDTYCGDGIRQHGEDCDDGDDDDGDGCDRFCRKPLCGNELVEGEEECDAPDNINCNEDCTLRLCGNGEIDDGETCDPPNSETCNANCLLSVCGNGIVELGEECDDNNQVDDDGCNSSCELNCTPPVTTGRRPK